MEKFDLHKFKLVFGFNPGALFLPDEKQIFQMSQAVDKYKGPVLRMEYGILQQDDEQVHFCLEVLWKIRPTDCKLVHEIENVILFHNDQEKINHQAEVQKMIDELDARKNF